MALIRDLRRHVPSPKPDEETEEEARNPAWWQAGWKAEPTPATPTTAKLIPIVTTADTIDAVELAQTYTRRWPVQENIIRDFLVPLGLDAVIAAIEQSREDVDAALPVALSAEARAEFNIAVLAHQPVAQPLEILPRELEKWAG